MALLTRMVAGLEFDRPVNLKKHYISPGGYEVESNGELIGFDFFESSITEAKGSPSHIEYVGRLLDTDTFPDARKLDKKFWIKGDWKFTEFYVYVGEPDEPEIHLKGVSSITLGFDDDSVYNIPRNKLKDIKEKM